MRKIIRATTVSQSLIFFDGTMESLSKDFEVILLSSSGPELFERESKYGVKVYPVEMFRRISPMKDIKSLYQLYKVFHKEKPVMVHSMTPKAGLLCMMAARMARVPIRLHTFTGLVWPTETGLKKKLLIFTDKVTCSCATHIIPEGEGVKNDLLENHITQKSLQVLGYGNVRGVDMDRYSRRLEIMNSVKEIRDESVVTFLFVGRIVKDKGINELCKAFSQLNKNYPDTRLFLVGNFEDDIDPISEKSRECIKNCTAIKAVGPKFGDDLVAYYAASDCFVFPSYREGFPNTVLEAGAMDLPCIVTDINGSREIIVEGENGTIIPPKDDNALYVAMEKMVLDKAWRERLANNSRGLIKERFDQKYVQKCLLDFYYKIIG